MSENKTTKTESWEGAEIVAYVRKSLVLGEEDRISEVKQRDAIQEVCERLRLGQPDWYSDVEGHRSGRYEHTRPGWRSAKARFLSAPKSIMIVYELDRSNRNVQAMADLIETIRTDTSRRRLIMIQNRFDSAVNGWGAREVRNLLDDAVSAQYESDKTSERMIYTIATLRAHQVPWGKAPYGMFRSGRGMKVRFSPAPYADQVVDVLRMYSTGTPIAEIVGRMNAEKRLYHKRAKADSGTTTTYAPWTPARVAGVVESAMVLGGYWTRVAGPSCARPVRSYGNGPLLAQHIAKYDYVRSPAIDPVIDEELLEAVLKTRLHWHVLRPRTALDMHVYLLSGILFHKEERLRGQTVGRKQYYRTRSAPSMSWYADSIEESLIERLSSLHFSEQVRIDVQQTIDAMRDNDRRHNAVDSRDKAARGILALERRFTLGDIEEPVYRALRAELNETIRAADLIISETEHGVDALSALNKMSETLRGASRRMQQTAIFALFSRISIDDNGQIVELSPRLWLRRAIRATAGAVNQLGFYQAEPSGHPTSRAVSTSPLVSADEAAAWLFRRLEVDNARP